MFGACNGCLSAGGADFLGVVDFVRVVDFLGVVDLGGGVDFAGVVDFVLLTLQVGDNLVVVERPWLQLLSNIGGTLHRKRFGK